MSGCYIVLVKIKLLYKLLHALCFPTNAVKWDFLTGSRYIYFKYYIISYFSTIPDLKEEIGKPVVAKVT